MLKIVKMFPSISASYLWCLELKSLYTPYIHIYTQYPQTVHTCVLILKMFFVWLYLRFTYGKDETK